MRATKAQPRIIDVINLIRILKRIVDPIGGELASVIANIIHEAKIDREGQIGNAYFRCKGCGVAYDCVHEYELDIGFINHGGVCCEGCKALFTVDDMRISEGWLERL